MQNFAKPYRGIGKNIEFQLNTNIPPSPNSAILYIHLNCAQRLFPA